MRVSTQQIFSQGLKGITNASSEVSRTQAQISSGQRVTNPSDDPVAATRILDVESEIALGAQYLRNIDNIEGRLELAETQISGIEQVIQRVRDLVLDAGSGAITDDQRSFLALEARERLSELEGLANSRDANGDYLFSGFRTSTAAFAQVGDGYVYQGDEGLRNENVASGLQMASNLTGKELFANIPIENTDVLVQPAQGNGSDVSVSRGRVVDQAVFDAVADEEFFITFNDLNAVVPAGPNYTITQASNGVAVVSDVPYALGDVIAFNGVEVEISGVPIPNDVYVVEAVEKRDMLTTVQRIADGLGSLADPDERDAFIADALNNLDAIQDSLLKGRSKIGARINTLETARSTQQSLDVVNQGILSELRDLDYAEAISRLSFQSFVLEAAQSSFARISNLSLFNFLR